jgi:hypothetical protein
VRFTSFKLSGLKPNRIEMATFAAVTDTSWESTKESRLFVKPQAIGGVMYDVSLTVMVAQHGACGWP